MKKHAQWVVGVAIVALSVLSGAFHSIDAQSMTITRDFSSETNLPLGTVVSVFSPDQPVQKTTQQNLANMYGVIAEAGDIAFSGPPSGDGVMVAVVNSGVFKTLVSNANGDINAGDPITVRSLEGIGEKATVSGRIIGIAQVDFNSSSEGATTTTVTDGTIEREIAIGLIDVRVNASDFTPTTTPIDQEDAANRNAIQTIADSVAGKTVRTFALVIASIILLTSIFIATFMITSSSYASMISIGRNPLAEKKVIKSLVGLILVAIAIFAVGVLLAYGVLIVLG